MPVSTANRSEERNKNGHGEVSYIRNTRNVTNVLCEQGFEGGERCGYSEVEVKKVHETEWADLNKENKKSQNITISFQKQGE